MPDTIVHLVYALVVILCALPLVAAVAIFLFAKTKDWGWILVTVAAIASLVLFVWFVKPLRRALLAWLRLHWTGARYSN